MKIGLIGLGRMGYNLALNALENAQQLVVYDKTAKRSKALASKGAVAAASIEELIEKLPSKKMIWLMIPAGKPVDKVLKRLLPLLNNGSIIIDGGNSFYKDSIKRAEQLAKRGITYLDIGTSGGVAGARQGACMMIGGNKHVYKTIEPFIKAVCVKNGYAYLGKSGAGHFVKMVHNGIEYGMMQAIGEGYELLKRSPFKLDLQKVSRVYRNGSVIRSWLIDLVGQELKQDPSLRKYTGKVAHSGEGQWTVAEAKRMRIKIPVIASSLKARFYSHKHPTFSSKILSALRRAFGGHSEQD